MLLERKETFSTTLTGMQDCGFSETKHLDCSGKVLYPASPHQGTDSGPSFTFPPSSVLFLLEIPLGKEGRPQMGADTLGLATYRAHHSQATCLAPMA